MPNYIRARDGSTYFFTVVTHERKPILCQEESFSSLREVKTSRPFKIKAWVLLPDHLHCMWELPPGDFDYSVRWALIKKEFTKRMKGRLEPGRPSASRRRKREGALWQRRFWEHRIRDEKDYETHCDYIHYNPVKHGLVTRAKDWEFSTFHRFLKEGVYPEGWGSEEVEFHGGIGGE